MKKILGFLLSLIIGKTALAMSCDTSWQCLSQSGKYSIEVQRCRYVNRIGALQFVKIDGRKIEDAVVTASYDSLSIGGSLLNVEVSIPDNKNDAHYVAFEFSGEKNKGVVIESIQEYSPGPQKEIAREEISCEAID